MNVPETFFSINEELILFGISCAFGLLIGVCYDVFRTARVIFPHNKWLVCIEDIVFLIFYCIFLSSFASAASRGELRFYFVIGNAIGFTLYLMTVGSIVIRTMRKLFYIIKKVVFVIFYPFIRFYAFISKKAASKFVGCSKVIVKCFKKVEILLLKPYHLLYNKGENKKRKNVKSVAKKVKTG